MCRYWCMVPLHLDMYSSDKLRYIISQRWSLLLLSQNHSFCNVSGNHRISASEFDKEVCAVALNNHFEAPGDNWIQVGEYRAPVNTP